MSKYFHYLSSIIIIFTINTASTDNLEQHKLIYSYINKLITQSSDILNDSKLSEEKKTNGCKKIMVSNLDLKWMASFVLGRKGLGALSKEQVNKFIEVYSNYVIKNYANLVKRYDDQEIKVISVDSIKEREFIVKASITLKKESNNINIEYLVRQDQQNLENFKIFDIITEGISLLHTQRSEFGNVLEAKGFDFLVSSLQAKFTKD